MAVSQNGWPVDPPRHSRLVPGTSDVRVTVADGPAGDVLMHVLAQLHARVESLELDSARGELDDWGYASRPIRGGTETSNHASATAVDINATRHPLGVHGTFSTAQVAEIHEILTEVRNVVRWGGDYLGRVDEMHFEINASSAAVAAVAAALQEVPMSFTPNDLLMASLWFTYPTDEAAHAAGLPVVNGRQERTEKHPLGEWIAVHCIRQGQLVTEAQRQTALLTEIRDELAAQASRTASSE